jgi:hypothetical protein
MFLIPMSQRPANIDKDILTQCKIFIGHGVEFPTDITYYKSIFRLPDLDTRMAAMRPGDAIFRMAKVEKIVTIIPPTTASPSETPGEVHVDRFVRATEAEGLQREVDAIEDREGTSVVATAYLRELEEAIPRMRAAIETATGHQRNLETRIAELEVAVPKEGESADLYARNVELTRKLAGAIQARNDAEKRAGPITLLMDLIKEANKEE